MITDHDHVDVCACEHPQYGHNLNSSAFDEYYIFQCAECDCVQFLHPIYEALRLDRD